MLVAGALPLVGLLGLVAWNRSLELLVLVVCLICFVANRCIRVVANGTVELWCDYATSTPRVLKPGFTLNNPLSYSVGAGIWWGFHGLPRGAMPLPGARLVLDPPQAEVHTLDKIGGKVDIAVETEVLDWLGDAPMLRKILMDHTSVRQRAFDRTQRWLAALFATLDAADATYGHVSTLLNDPAHLAALNTELSVCHLRALSISLDANGVVLDAKWARQLSDIQAKRQAQAARETELVREAALAALDREAQHAAHEFELQRERDTAEARASVRLLEARKHLEIAEAEAEVCRVRDAAQAHAIGALVTAGVSAADAANMAVAASNVKMVAAAAEKGASVCVAPTVLGINGLAAMMPSQ